MISQLSAWCSYQQIHEAIETFSVFALPDMNTSGFGRIETVMQTRDKVEGLHDDLPTPRVFISVCANRGKIVFYSFFKILS